MKPLILASSSPYRKKLLAKLHLQFDSCSPDIDESKKQNETALELVARLAREKAQAVKLQIEPQLPSHIIIGSDQVAVLNDTILTKPGTESNAIKQLAMCSGQTVQFLTGLCLLNEKNERQETVEVFEVTFRQLTSEQIKNYVSQEQPLDCAGSFKVEGLGISLFQSLKGDDPNSLIGLPLIKLCDFLKQWSAFPLDNIDN